MRWLVPLLGAIGIIMGVACFAIAAMHPDMPSKTTSFIEEILLERHARPTTRRQLRVVGAICLVAGFYLLWLGVVVLHP